MVALLERGVRNAERGMKGDDPFVEEVTEQIRVLRLVADDARPHPSHDGSVLTPRLRPQPRGEGETFSASRRSGSRRDYSCVVEIWQQEEKKGKRDKQEWKLVETRIPLRLGKPLPLIPFVFHGPNHAQPGVEKLPMADIIAVNLDHYRLDADYKHGVHFAARTDSLGVLWQVGHVVDRVKRRWVTATFGAAAGHL